MHLTMIIKSNIKCLFLILSLLGTSGIPAFAEYHEFEYIAMTPEIFKREFKKINAKKNDSDLDGAFLDFKTGDTEDEIAKKFLEGIFDRKMGYKNENGDPLKAARDGLKTLLEDKKYKRRYSFTLKDILREIDRANDDEYNALSTIDKKTLKEFAKKKISTDLYFHNGRPYFETMRDHDSKEYKIPSMTRFCAMAREIYPTKTYVVDGKKLVLDYERAVYGSKVIYDYCSEDLLKMAKDLFRASEHFPEAEIDTTGHRYGKSASPASLAGPLFSYWEFYQGNDRPYRWEDLVVLNLRTNEPARFEDWFEPKSLSLPCPDEKTLESTSDEYKYMHCRDGGEIQTNQFVFLEVNKKAKLDVWVNNFSWGEIGYRTMSTGSAKPNKALLEAVKNAGSKNMFFQTTK